MPRDETKWDLAIGGEWLATEEYDTIRLPFDGSEVAVVARGNSELVARAVEAARAAAGVLAGWGNGERAELLDRVAALLARDRDEFAGLICSETGKPIVEARGEVDRALQTLAASSMAARELRGEVVPIAGRMAMTVREPLGVVGIITPFNFPLNLAMHKLGPALAGGNAVVHKPSEQTPLSALRLARSFEAAGAPPGAYNVVTGTGEAVGRALVESRGVDMITFTGSVPTGTAIRAAAGLKKVTLELGGNCAVIVERDADVDAAVARVAQGGYSFSGQVCISVQRVYVQNKAALEFTEKLCAAVAALRMGNPRDEGTQVASLISKDAARRVETWTGEAVRAGAKLLVGGERCGATVTPGVLTDVPEECTLMSEELFGPLVAVNAYRDLDDAIARVNGTAFGLQAGVYTRDLERAFHAARKIRAGGVMVNDVPTFRADAMPYGGVKNSGIGREGPRYAVEEMTNLKLICWQ